MKLAYSSMKDEDVFTLTDFTCEMSQHLLDTKGLFKVIWNKGDVCTIKIDDYRVELGTNQVIFCTPLNVLEVPIDNRGVVAFVFNKQFFCIQTHDEEVSCNGFLFFGSAQAPVIQLTDKEVDQFNLLKRQFEGDFETKDALQGEMLRTLLKRLLIISTRMSKDRLPQSDISNNGLKVIRDFNILVEKHFREYHQVKDYANLLFKSPKTLSNLFPKYGDKTPLMIINERILLEAKRLLIYSDKSTSEIATELGYNDTSNFSKFFKKHEGLSPNAFKKKKLTAA